MPSIRNFADLPFLNPWDRVCPPGTGKRLSRALAASLALHVSAAVPFLLPGGAGIAAVVRAVHLFAPPRTRETPAPAPRPLLAIRLAAPAAAPAEPAPVPGPPGEVRLDLRLTPLTFEPDTVARLPEVVRAHHGKLALLDGKDQAIARYLLEPPGWDAREALEDVSSYFRLRMAPAAFWREFRTAAARRSIALDNYTGCALLSLAYSECLKSEIRREAVRRAAGARVRVAGARLAVAPARPCGIEVLEVSLETID